MVETAGLRVSSEKEVTASHAFAPHNSAVDKVVTDATLDLRPKLSRRASTSSVTSPLPLDDVPPPFYPQPAIAPPLDLPTIQSTGSPIEDPITQPHANLTQYSSEKDNVCTYVNQLLENRQFPLDATVYEAAIEAVASSHRSRADFTLLIKLFDHMVRRNLSPSPRAYQTLILAHLQHDYEVPRPHAPRPTHRRTISPPMPFDPPPVSKPLHPPKNRVPSNPKSTKNSPETKATGLRPSTPLDGNQHPQVPTSTFGERPTKISRPGPGSLDAQTLAPVFSRRHSRNKSPLESNKLFCIPMASETKVKLGLRGTMGSTSFPDVDPDDPYQTSQWSCNSS